MGRYNEILVGRFNRALQKLSGIKGEVPSPQLASEIIPVMELPLGVEFRYLESWGLFSNQVPIAASAGNTNGYRLRNPLGSNVIAVIEKWTVESPSVATDLVLRVSAAIGVPDTDLAGGVSRGTPYDLRSIAQSMCITSTGSPSVSFGNAPYRWTLGVAPSLPLELIQKLDDEIPVLPGTCVQIETGAINLVLNVALRWRERFLEESERT